MSESATAWCRHSVLAPCLDTEFENQRVLAVLLSGTLPQEQKYGQHMRAYCNSRTPLDVPAVEDIVVEPTGTAVEGIVVEPTGTAGKLAVKDKVRTWLVEAVLTDMLIHNCLYYMALADKSQTHMAMSMNMLRKKLAATIHMAIGRIFAPKPLAALSQLVLKVGAHKAQMGSAEQEESGIEKMIAGLPSFTRNISGLRRRIVWESAVKHTLTHY